MGIKQTLRKIPLLRHINLGRKIENDEHYQEVRSKSIQEINKKPSRTEILNYLLGKLKGERSYLEIGVRNPDHNYNHINAEIKYSVDPGVEYKLNPVDFKMTSDEFFEKLKKGEILSSDIKFDIIFIDGLHLAEQVEKDIDNALLFLKEDGYLLLHDCNPPTEWHARENFYYMHTPAHGDWNGTTWKAFQKRRYEEGLYTCCIDTDWGVGVISKTKQIGNPIVQTNEYYEYHVMAKDRVNQLGLISFDEFKKIID